LRSVFVLAFERRRVLAHEVVRPGDAGEIDGHAAAAEAHAAIAVTVALIGAMLRQTALRPQHRPKPRPTDCCVASLASLRRLPDRRPGMSCRPWWRSRAWRASCRRRARS